MNQNERALTFQALHQADEIFVIGNPWDAGSARILAGLGYRALATSSSAMAGTLGRQDGQVTREEALAHCRVIVSATDLPVSADLEKCFADDLAGVGETVRLAADTGLVGGSIEDATGDASRPLFSLDEAVARVAAAVMAARTLPFPFTLTARTENFLRGNPNLDDTIRRLLAFQAAGADVLMAPGLPDIEAVRKVCAAVSRPVNFMAGMKGRSFSIAQLAEAGVKRVSVAGSLFRAAMTGLITAATEVQVQGSFGYLNDAIPTADFNALLAGGQPLPP